MNLTTHFFEYFGLEYFDQFQDRNESEVLLLAKTLAQNHCRNVLDLGCGIGRHSVGLAEFGFQVTGVDSSPQYIQSCKKFESKNLKFVRKDFKSYFAKNKNEDFDAIISMNNCFGYQENMQDDLEIFEAVAKALKPQGVFIFSFLNEKIIDYLVSQNHLARVDLLQSKVHFSLAKDNSEVKEKSAQLNYSLRVLKKEQVTALFEGFGLIRDPSFDDSRLISSPFESIFLFKKN